MDRCAVFVDAGYLYGAATSLLADSHSRRTLRTDQPAMISSLRALAEQETGLQLLRIYWYDASRNKVPQPEQRTLALLSDVKLRLGNLRRRDDGRYMQKGVDADLHADMTQLARNGGATDFVLVSGDEDLLRAVDEAQGYGVRVHLWGVDAGSDGFNQSLELSAAADRRHHLDEAFLRTFFEVVPDPEELVAGIEQVAAATTDNGGEVVIALVDEATGTTDPAPGVDHAVAQPAPTSAETAAELAGSTDEQASTSRSDGSDGSDGAAAAETADPVPATPEPDSEHGTDGTSERPADQPSEPVEPAQDDGATAARPSLPSPADLARVAPKPAPVRTPVAAEPGISSAATREYLKLSELSTRDERFRDTEEDAARTGDSPYDVGRTYGVRWRLRATQFAVNSVRSLSSVPHSIDGDLLRYAERRGVDTWHDDQAKYAVRDGFMDALRDATPAG